MRASAHFFAGAAVAAASTGLRLVDPTEALGMFWTSALLDIDHLGYYLVRFRDPSLTRAVRFFEERLDVKCYSLCALHTVEFVIAFGLIALSSNFLMACFVGVLVRLTLDVMQGICTGRLSYRWWSIAQYLCAGGHV